MYSRQHVWFSGNVPLTNNKYDYHSNDHGKLDNILEYVLWCRIFLNICFSRTKSITQYILLILMLYWGTKRWVTHLTRILGSVMIGVIQVWAFSHLVRDVSWIRSSCQKFDSGTRSKIDMKDCGKRHHRDSVRCYGTYLRYIQLKTLAWERAPSGDLKYPVKLIKCWVNSCTVLARSNILHEMV